MLSFEIDVINKEDRIIDDDPAEKNHADIGGGIERKIGYDEGHEDTDQGEGDSEDDEKGLDQRFIKGSQDHENDDQRKDDGKFDLAFFLLGQPPFFLESGREARRQLDFGEDRFFIPLCGLGRAPEFPHDGLLELLVFPVD